MITNKILHILPAPQLYEPAHSVAHLSRLTFLSELIHLCAAWLMLDWADKLRNKMRNKQLITVAGTGREGGRAGMEAWREGGT